MVNPDESESVYGCEEKFEGRSVLGG